LSAGEFRPGERLPSIAALMDHYDVPGLNTVRQAQQLLVDEGLIETRQGSGAYVLRTAPEESPASTASVRPVVREHDAWAALESAGISAEDVEAVVQSRVRNEQARALSMVDILRSVDLGVEPGANVPEKRRYGKGSHLTDTDIMGALRALAAAEAHWRSAAVTRDVEQVRARTLHGMARREADGQHDTNLQLIDIARTSS
jgi:DNA-binding transcriptional regulator YhcF (GntR family)